MNYKEFSKLQDKKLLNVNSYEDGTRVFKYSKRAFWSGAVSEYKDLEDLRGLVLDKNDNIINYPFTKIYNYRTDTGCTETGISYNNDLEVTAIDKVNGFLGSVSVHNGKLVCSSTGSLDNDYAKMIYKWCDEYDIFPRLKELPPNTYMFEVCDPNDPHIIEEQYGLHLIGARPKAIGSRMCLESALDAYGEHLGVMRPQWYTCSFGEAVEASKGLKIEGYIIRESRTGVPLCKLKSPYYLGSKFISRMTDRKAELLYDDTTNFIRSQDEEFSTVIEHIVRTIKRNDFVSMQPLERLMIIREYFESV